MQLVRFEIKKIISYRVIVITLLSILAIGFGYSYLFENQSDSDWRNFAKEEKAEIQGYIDQTDREDEFAPTILETFQKEINQIDFCLENNILYGTESVWTCWYKLKYFLGIITILSIIWGSNVISVERTSNMNEKLLSKEFNKKKLIGEKYIAIFVMTFIGIIVGYMELFGISVIRFQKFDYYYIATTTNGILEKSNVIIDMLYFFVGLLLATLIYCACAMLLEILLPNKKLTVVGVELAFLFNSQLYSLSTFIKIGDVLPFRYLRYGQYNSNTEISSLIGGWAYLVILLLVIIAVTIFINDKTALAK